MTRNLEPGLEPQAHVRVRMYRYSGATGGVSVISHKYAKANNHYLPDYDENKKNTYLIQLDCNNLYGKSMSEKLPVNGFKYVEFITEEFIKSKVTF
jgi:hypothetical protein